MDRPALSLVSIDVPGVLAVGAQPGADGDVLFHVREVAGERTMLDLANVKTWANIEAAAEVNAIGDPIEEDIECIDLKPYDVRFIRLRFAKP